MAEDYGCEPEFEPISAEDIEAAEGVDNSDVEADKPPVKSNRKDKKKERLAKTPGAPPTKKSRIPTDDEILGRNTEIHKSDSEHEVLDDEAAEVSNSADEEKKKKKKKPKKKKAPKKSLKDKRRAQTEDSPVVVQPESSGLIENKVQGAEDGSLESAETQIGKDESVTETKVATTTEKKSRKQNKMKKAKEGVDESQEATVSNADMKNGIGEKITATVKSKDDQAKKANSKKKKPKKKPMDFEEKVRVRAEYRALDEKYKEVLEKMVDVEHEFGARQVMRDLIDAETITEGEIPVVLQRWRQMKRKKVYAERVDGLVQSELPLDKLKEQLNELVRKQKISPKDAGMIVHKWQTREHRRLRRQAQVASTKACYHCREPGHTVSTCPRKDDAGAAMGNDGICFKCGATEHAIKECPKKNVRGFPFATCFVCKQEGHLSRDCAENKWGIYPDSGSCKECGSKMHKVRDCPTIVALRKAEESEQKQVELHQMTAMSRADEEPEYTKVAEDENTTTTKKKKVVKF